MVNVLQINSSIFGANGKSTGLAQKFLEEYKKNHSDVKLILRDFTETPVPHLNALRMGAFMTPPETRTEEQHEIVQYSDTLIQEIKDADVIVLTLPMYNFGIPSELKAYFDHIARAGVSFKYTETGPVGLLKDKPVYILATRGGKYLGTDLDTQTGYVKSFLNFIGLKNIRFVYAEGLNMGEEMQSQALTQASQTIYEIAK